MRRPAIAALLIMLILITGCQTPRIRLFPSQADPLQEYILEGKGDGKILVVQIRGVISNSPQEGFVRTRPSVVQEVVSQLRLAEKDKNVKAVILKIDSPGGTVTASDILYNEIAAFKKRTKIKVVVAMMGVVASGGYYIALPADYIQAHPTTVTGSIGVIFVRPKLAGLMQKIGVSVEVNKSGADKDMGSPFRQTSAEEEQIFQNFTDRLGVRFVDLVARHRKLQPEVVDQISSARIYLADEALELGLVDAVGYLEDAVNQSKKLAGLAEDAKVVVYRRTEYPDDNIYNTSTRYGGDGKLSLISMELPGSLNHIQTGFYYLWPAALSDD
ncbi:MAG: signal peptide peptidase SppA [Desulfobacteraceae bacterium]|jgi:protease-4|nr:signal peptide peptidase SppA [Desulfobacteraceae bacterium]